MDVTMLIPIVLFMAIAAVLIVHLASRHKERIHMIEKGLTGDEIKAMYSRQIRSNPLTGLMWGLMFAFVGVALIFGNLLDNKQHVGDGVIIGLVTLSAGMALVIYYRIATKSKLKDE